MLTDFCKSSLKNKFKVILTGKHSVKTHSQVVSREEKENEKIVCLAVVNSRLFKYICAFQFNFSAKDERKNELNKLDEYD
jgi:23S rRNA U2552 (ribose-2'-O)-methylase RlmE/FtsJ